MAVVTNATLCSPRPSADESSKSPIIVNSSLDLEAIPANHIVIKVDRFGFSANNITYQALGEHPHFRCVSSPVDTSRVSHINTPQVL
jgi:hypothetical protein